jgi:hypothetical protein
LSNRWSQQGGAIATFFPAKDPFCRLAPLLFRQYAAATRGLPTLQSAKMWLSWPFVVPALRTLIK